MTNKCRFCEKVFKSEQTLSKHLCVKKQRFSDKDTIGSQLGFRVFQRFFELTTLNKKPKTFLDFIDSQFYLAFVRFGRHLVDLNPIDSNDFIDFLIKKGVKLDEWHKDSLYTEYLKIHMEKEPVERAVERSILEMNSWAENNKKELKQFFTDINTVEAVFLLKSGRISPWVLYLSDSATDLMQDFTLEQLNIIKEVINPSRWQNTFMEKKQDVVFVKKILREAGL